MLDVGCWILDIQDCANSDFNKHPDARIQDPLNCPKPCPPGKGSLLGGMLGVYDFINKQQRLQA